MIVSEGSVNKIMIGAGVSGWFMVLLVKIGRFLVVLV